MAFDVLFVSSDSQGAGFYRPEEFRYLVDRYGMREEEVPRLIFGATPWWNENGVPMSYPAAENWVNNGRRFSLTQAELDRHMKTLSTQTLTRFGNGIYVSSHLLKEGYSTKLINNLATEWEQFLQLLNQGPRVIAISTTFLESREATEATARRIREVAPGVPIIVGGPLVMYSHKILTDAPHHHAHAQIKRNYWFCGEQAEPAIDGMIIEARGEATLAELVRCVREGRSWKELHNVAYPDAAGRWIINPRKEEFVDVNAEGVQWDLLPDDYLGREVGIRGSRGCPLRCKFCSFVVIHPDFEVKEVDSLRLELRKLATRRDIVKHISFVDDNLFLTRKSVHDYTKMMVDEKLPFTWSAFVRVDSIDETNARLMKESGCTFLMLGVESGDVNLLKEMRKAQKPEKVLRAMNLLSDVGISTLSTLVVGFPTETSQTIDNTIALLNAYPDRGSTLHWFNCWVHTLVPLTPADKERSKWGLEGIQLDWKHDTMDVAQAFHERERLMREVRRGGAYNGPYAFDSIEAFSGAGEAGWQDMRRFFKLRHRIGCLDYFREESMDGFTREETLREVERLVRATHARQRGPIQLRVAN